MKPIFREARRLSKKYFTHRKITETNFFRTHEILNVQFSKLFF